MFREDTRGQSVQVGVIILLAFAVIAFASYQAVIVPQQNQQVEFDHNQAVQRDIVDTRNAIARAANAGQSGTASIQLGERFPPRIFALNAPAANGRFATTSRGNIGVTNTDVCPGPDATVRASYTPNYSYYHNAPTTKYENTFVFNEFDDGTERVRTDARLLFGEDDTSSAGVVNLIALFGDTQQSGTETISVDLYSGVGKSQTITDPEITLPTSAKASTWAEALGYDSVGELTGTPGVDSLSVTTTDGTSEVSIQLRGEYEIVCTEVGMDSVPPSGLSTTAFRPGIGGGGGLGFSSVTASDLQQNANSETQVLTFTPNTVLPADATVSIDLSDAQGVGTNNGPTPVDYRSASASVTDGGGSVQFTSQNDDSAILEYTPANDINSGETVTIEVSNIETGETTDDLSVSFDRSDGGSASTTFTLTQPSNTGPTAIINGISFSGNQNNGRLTVDWQATDNRDGMTGTITVYESNNGQRGDEQQDPVEFQISGDSASGSIEMPKKVQTGSEYIVVFEVEDSEGNTDSDKLTTTT